MVRFSTSMGATNVMEILIEKQIPLARPAHTRALARELTKWCPERGRQLLLLSGDLGSGKTTFAREFCSALGLPENQVFSPTFSLYNQYRVPGEDWLVTHLDLYRLAPEELFELGLEELVAESRFVLCEWWERARDLFLENWAHSALVLEFSVLTEEVNVSSGGDWDPSRLEEEGRQVVLRLADQI